MKVIHSVYQGVHSRGQHDWVYGFPEQVKLFITFVILSHISSGKEKTTSYFSTQDCVKVSPGLLYFPRLPQTTEENTENSPRLGAHFSCLR